MMLSLHNRWFMTTSECCRQADRSLAVGDIYVTVFPWCGLRLHRAHRAGDAQPVG